MDDHLHDGPRDRSHRQRYLQIVGPVYALYGFGIGGYFACQGYGSVLPAVAGNLARVLVAAGGGWASLMLLGTTIEGLFAAVAVAFTLYAAANATAILRVSARARQELVARRAS